MAVDCGRRVWAYRSTFILILTPIILLPIAVLPPPELKSVSYRLKRNRTKFIIF